MRNRLARWLRSAAVQIRKGSRREQDRTPSRLDLRKALLELLSDSAIARRAAPLLARVYGVQGGNPGTLNHLAKFDSMGGTIDSTLVEVNGNLGVGTEAPAARVHLKDAQARMLFEGTGPPARTWFMGTDNSPDSFFLFDQTSNATRFSVASSGNIGLGTQTPATLVHLKAGAPQATFEGTLVPRTWVLGANNSPDSFFLQDATAGQTRLLINSTGNVGIGTTSPSNKLHIEGGNAQIGSPDGTSSGWRTLLLGKSAPKQQSFGPEMITAAAKNSSDAQNRRVVMWAGAEGDVEAMFLLNSTGFLEWGAGGSADQDSSLGRNATTGEMALINDKAFVVGRSGPAGGAELLRVNTDPNNANFIVNINGAGSSATLDVKGHSTTKPTIRAQQGSATADVFGGFVVGDSNLRFEIAADGKVSWGKGTSTPDVDLSRFEGGSPSTKGLKLAGGDVYVSLAGKGIILKNSAGTVCRRVRLNDAGNGLIFDSITCP